MSRPTRFLLLAGLPLLLSLAACEQKKSAAELKTEAEQRVRADKLVKARKYYNELVQKYPDSPYAEQARQKLQAMGPAPVAKK